jgi:hypothetical protein
MDDETFIELDAGGKYYPDFIAIDIEGFFGSLKESPMTAPNVKTFR